MAIYGTPSSEARAAPAHAATAPDLPQLTTRQHDLRVRVCATAADLHGRLVTLAALRNPESDDKEAVRTWLFAAHADELIRPPVIKQRWSGEDWAAAWMGGRA